MRPSWELSGVRTEHQTFVRRQGRSWVTVAPRDHQTAPNHDSRGMSPYLVLRPLGVRRGDQVGREETVGWYVPHPSILYCGHLCRSWASALDFL